MYKVQINTIILDDSTKTSYPTDKMFLYYWDIKLIRKWIIKPIRVITGSKYKHK